MEPELKAALLAGIEELGKDIQAECLQKRIAEAHKEAIMRGSHHVNKAIKTHMKACKAAKDASDAHNAMLEGMGKLLGGFQKTLDAGKAALAKAGEVASDSLTPALREVFGHLEIAHKAVSDMHALHEKMATAHKAIMAQNMKTADHHELARGYMGKVASSWVGESSETPFSAGDGYKPTVEGENTSQSTMTEGDVPDYDPMKPYPGKAAGNGNVNKGSVSEEEARLREENAFLKGRIEAEGNQPRNDGVKLFRMGGGVFPTDDQNGGNGGNADSDIVSALLKGQVSPHERALLANGDDDMRKTLSARAIGTLASSALRGDLRYAHGLHELRTPHELVENRRGTAPVLPRTAG